MDNNIKRLSVSDMQSLIALLSLRGCSNSELIFRKEDPNDAKDSLHICNVEILFDRVIVWLTSRPVTEWEYKVNIELFTMGMHGGFVNPRGESNDKSNNL